MVELAATVRLEQSLYITEFGRGMMISWKKSQAAQIAEIPAEVMECKTGIILAELEKPSGEREGRSGGNEPQTETAGRAD